MPIRGTATTQLKSAANNTYNMTLPATIANGDLIVLFAEVTGNNLLAGTPTLFDTGKPAGFTHGDSGANSNINAGWWWKLADGTEDGTTVSWDFGTVSRKFAATAVVLYGVDPDLADWVAAETVSQATGTSVALPQITTVVNGSDVLSVVMMGANQSGGAFTPPAGWTAVTDTIGSATLSQDPTMRTAHIVDTTAGTHDGTWTIEFPNGGRVLYQIAFPHVAVVAVADAGPDQSVVPGQLVTLTAAGSVGEGSLTYAWTQTGGTSTAILSSTTAASPTFFAPPGPDTLTFSVLVTDTSPTTDTDTISVTVSAAAAQLGLPVKVRDTGAWI